MLFVCNRNMIGNVTLHFPATDATAAHLSLKVSQQCHMIIVQRFPSGAYCDNDEIKRLTDFGGVQVHLTSV